MIRDALVRLRPQLIAYARAICDSPEEADDLLHDAIERALKASSAPTSPDDLRFWMFRVIRNLHLDERRKARVRAEYVEHHKRLLGDDTHDEDDPLQNLLVRQSFAALSQPNREVVFLVDIMGMRYSEAAGVLAVPEGTVMSRLSRARQAMLDRLAKSNVAPLPRRKRN